MRKFTCFIGIGIFLIFASKAFAEPEFTTQELQKIKQIIHEMAEILEGNHKEILEIEEVLARANTQLRKSRNKERLRRKVNSFKDRVKDLRKLRSGFSRVLALREFAIAVDDRLKVMEDNVALIEKIYFPVVIDPLRNDANEDDYPTFINPGDPRYELDDDQERLARSIQKTKNLMTLRASREPLNDGFDNFVNQMDVNLKAEDKPKQRLTPVLGYNTLDQFHKQLTEAQRSDPTFDWNETRNHKEFREFYQEVEHLDRQPSENRIVTGFPKVDSPDGSKSRKTFDELVQKMATEANKWEKRRVVLETMGTPMKMGGFNKYMNDVRIDSHKVASQDFGNFINEMKPMHDEMILTYQKGIIKKDTSPESVIQAKSSLAWVNTDEEYLRKLRNKRVFEQADDFYRGEKLIAERTRRKTKTRVFTGANFNDAVVKSQEYIDHDTNVTDHRYRVKESAEFFSKTDAPIVHEHEARKKMVKHRVGNEKTLVPVTIQLLDEQQVPHGNVELEFQLQLPESAPKVVGAILEGGKFNPLSYTSRTNGNGEATIHLLMTLYNREISVEREISQENDRLVCKVKVKMLES